MCELSEVDISDGIKWKCHILTLKRKDVTKIKNQKNCRLIFCRNIKGQDREKRL